jgi:hypothetical protein
MKEDGFYKNTCSFIRKYKFRLGGDTSMGRRQKLSRVPSEIAPLGRVLVSDSYAVWQVRHSVPCCGPSFRP